MTGYMKNKNEVELWTPQLTQICHILLSGLLATGTLGTLLLAQHSLKYWVPSVHLKDPLCLVAKGPKVNVWYV